MPTTTGTADPNLAVDLLLASVLAATEQALAADREALAANEERHRADRAYAQSLYRAQERLRMPAYLATGARYVSELVYDALVEEGKIADPSARALLLAYRDLFGRWEEATEALATADREREEIAARIEARERLLRTLAAPDRDPDEEGDGDRLSGIASPTAADPLVRRGVTVPVTVSEAVR